MQDRYQELFARYATAQYHLPPETIHEVKRRVLDSLGVMCAAIDGAAPRAARAYARLFPFANGATIFGTEIHSTPEMAGFVNGVHCRYLDFNDTYLSLEPLHPSDVIMPLLALAETRGASGSELIEAIAIAYEVGMNLCDAASLRAHGWDHVSYIGIACAAAAARLMRLDAHRTAQAISIAIVPHAASRQTRAGELSMWKGAAAANSARNGLFAALLATGGFTGPYEPFTGKMGMIAQLLGGEPFRAEALKSFERCDPPRRICDAYIKKYPVEYHAQSAVDAAVELHGEIERLESVPEAERRGLGIERPVLSEVDGLEIETFRAAYEIIVDDPEKWKPRTRETADHSLQYIVCAALVDGKVTRETFAEERIEDKRIAELLGRTKVTNSARLTAMYPESIPVKIIVHTRDGGVHSREARYPRGHSGNKMTDDEVIAKFEQNRAGVLDDADAERLREIVWKLDSVQDLRELTALFPRP